MLNAIRRSAQKSIMTVTSWYHIPEKGMDRFEVLAMSSCLPLVASKQYEYKYHFVCPFHVIAPYLFKSYFPDSTFPWLQDVHEENVIVTAEFRDEQGRVTNRIGVNNKLIMHEWRDLCCFHLHKEEEALITLKMYGMDSVTEEAKVEPKDALPSSLEEMDSFIQKATTEAPPPRKNTQRRLRKEDEPYNSIYACEIDEVSPQRGEPILLVGHQRIVQNDKDGRDISLMRPCSFEGRALRSENGRSMVSSTGILPPGMVGGGAFDIHGNCKGMIEGVVQKPGSTINGHFVKNTHAQNVYENCAAVINADVLSDFVGNVELGLLDDMQEEVKELRKKMGEEAIQEEQKKILKPMMESFTKK
ncbi:hypothetical protein WA556_002261, partial [Blastocystis sp. ATCC 50177/Nand II]